MNRREDEQFRFLDSKGAKIKLVPDQDIEFEGPLIHATSVLLKKFKEKIMG